MSHDFRIPVRKAILSALKADDAVTALVPAAQIYPARTPAEPQWPFQRYGIASFLPLKSSGEDGQVIATAVHSFARATDSQPDGEQAASDIAAATAALLDGPEGKGLVLDLGEGTTAIVRVEGGRTLQDEEADDWHSITNIEVTVSAAA
jgi:hypothetical protein